jgi:enoyl-[acyl-carrier protein] reductase II
LRTSFVEEWLAEEKRGQAQCTDEPIIGQTHFMGQTIPLIRFSSLAPSNHAQGDIDSMSFLAGQSVGLVNEIKPAGKIVRELVADAEQIIAECLLPLVPEKEGGAFVKSTN